MRNEEERKLASTPNNKKQKIKNQWSVAIGPIADLAADKIPFYGKLIYRKTCLHFAVSF